MAGARGFVASACAAALSVLLLMAADVQAQSKPGPKPAAVDDQEARDLFRLGKQAFDEGRYERALKYFKDAYDLSGRAQLQFNIGTVLDRLRRDREAIDAYKSYLAQTPDAQNRDVVEERIRLLQDGLAKPDAPRPAETAPLPAAERAPVSPVAPPPTAAKPPAPSVPTPAETARASTPAEPSQEHAAVSATASASAETSGEGVTSRWWFWTGIGAVVVGAVVAGVVVGTSSTQHSAEGPAVLGPATRVRPL